MATYMYKEESRYQRFKRIRVRATWQSKIPRAWILTDPIKGESLKGTQLRKNTGVDRTVHIEKKVLFSDVVQKCKTPPHFDNLKLELAARGIHHSVNPKVKELKDLLKQDEKNKWISENLRVDKRQRDKRQVSRRLPETKSSLVLTSTMMQTMTMTMRMSG